MKQLDDRHAAKSKTKLKDEASDNSLQFVDSKSDPERSDVIFEGEKIGDVGTNLVGLITEYYGLYKHMEASIKEHNAKELDKDRSLDHLKGLVAKQDKSAVDITLYQIGMKAFNGFKGVVSEEDTSKKFSQSKAVLKEVKRHIDILLGSSVFLTEHNIENLKEVARKLNSIAEQLETFKPSGRVAKVPGLPALVSAYLKKESNVAKNVAASFLEAVSIYGEGPACIVKIPSAKETKKDQKKEAKAEKKAAKGSSSSSKKGFW